MNLSRNWSGTIHSNVPKSVMKGLKRSLLFPFMILKWIKGVAYFPMSSHFKIPNKELISRGEKLATGFWYVKLCTVQRNFIRLYRIYVFEFARFHEIWVPDEASSRKLRSELYLLESRQLCSSSIWATITPRLTKFRSWMDESYVLPWICRWCCLEISHESFFSEIRVRLSDLVHMMYYRSRKKFYFCRVLHCSDLINHMRGDIGIKWQGELHKSASRLSLNKVDTVVPWKSFKWVEVGPKTNSNVCVAWS